MSRTSIFVRPIIVTACIAIALPSCSTAVDPPMNDMAAVIDETIAQTMEDEQIPGAVFVMVRDGRIEMFEGYGSADLERNVPVDPKETIFRLGSITKFLTALAVLRLVDRGELGLDEAVSARVSPEIDVDRYDTPVRVRDLLRHTGGFDQTGLGRHVSDPAERPDLESFLRAELVPFHPPGIIGIYDTYGITLAGHLVEVVTGEDYASQMRRHLFEPLAMNDTWVEASSSERLARGYGIEDGKLVPLELEHYVTLPASSVDSTAADMGRLLIALLGEGSPVLGPRILDRIHHEPGVGYAPDHPAFSWGLWEDEWNGWRVLHHGGMMRGYSTELVLIPEKRIGFFTACNRDSENGPPVSLHEKVGRVVAQRLLEDRSGTRPETIRTDSSRFAGAYAGAVGCFTCVPGEGWPLNYFQLRAPEPGVLESSRRWRAIGPNDFIEEDGDRRLTFIDGEDGRVRYLAIGPQAFVRLDEHLLDERLGEGWKEHPATPLEAVVYLANEDWDPASRAWSELATQYPDNGRVHYYSGLTLLHTGDTAGARRSFGRALELGRWPGWSLYYIASTWAAEGNEAKAFEILEQATSRGFGDPGLLRTEPWWDSLRSDPRYLAAMEQLGG